MGFGGSILLIALGAILAFAVKAEVGWLDLSVVGWVLMLAGIIGLATTAWFWQNRKRAVVAAPVERAEVVEEYREVRRPPL